jgi:hypothetical protein
MYPPKSVLARLVLLAALLIVALTLLVNAARGDPRIPVICVLNQSSTVSDTQITDALPAFQAAIDQDLGPEWDAFGVLVLIPAGTPAPAGCWPMTLVDAVPVAGAAGYHELGAGHLPDAIVGTQTRFNWQLVFTHELEEMLVDPNANRVAFVQPDRSFYYVEVADPVELHWYTRPSATGLPVIISDFVTERWYDAVGGGPMDHMHLLTKAHQILPGGYAYQWDGIWVQHPRPWVFRGPPRRGRLVP